jgi:hypothetical protein
VFILWLLQTCMSGVLQQWRDLSESEHKQSMGKLSHLMPRLDVFLSASQVQRGKSGRVI